MKRFILFLTVYIVFHSIGYAQKVSSKEWSTKGFSLSEITVYGERPMKEIGAQLTKFDSVVLKENIALSMADVLTFNSPIFVKSYGRATLSTVSFRGTSPSHSHG